MKLSAILVSVNIVAAAPLAANATEAVSDKADWLKKNLAAISRQSGARAEQRKLSIDAPLPKKKLRAFVPGRKLPSARDLSMQYARYDTAPQPSLVAQQPVLAETYPLSAQIYAYGPPPVPAAPQPAAMSSVAPRPVQRPRAQVTPRAVPYRVPTLPGQIAASRTPSIPVIPEPPALRRSPAQDYIEQNYRQASAMPQTPPPQPMKPPVVARAVPALAPDAQQMLDQLVELNAPGRSKSFIDIQNGQQVAMPAPESNMSAYEGMSPMAPAQQMQAPVAASRPDIGPPPFPLNMLPPDALQDLVGRRSRARTHIATQPVYFGSWHKASGLAAGQRLPYAGFHSQIHNRKVSGSHFAPYIAPGHTAPRHHARASAPIRHSAPPQPTIAVYAPYENISRVSMF
jgi:hypothetical protein